MEFKIPENVQFVLNSFQEKGYKAFIAGADLCELVLGRTMHLCTVFTTADGDNVKKIFKKSVEKDNALSITCNDMVYRIEHIDSVLDILDDEIFGIHSMYYSVLDGLVDNHGALFDI